MEEIKNRMPLSQLALTAEYQKLTQKQQLFCATYISGGLLDGNYDPVAATLTAYKCRSMEVARIMSYSMMANIRIVAVLNLHFGTTPSEQFLEVLDRAIRNKNLSPSQLAALKLKCDIMGFANRLPDKVSSPMFAPPKEVQDAAAEARKAKRKKPAPKVTAPVIPSDWGF